MNVLITSASRKVSLIRAFQEALRQEAGGNVVAADLSPNSPALYLADDYELLPPSAEPGFIDVILQICKDRKIALVVPTRDEELLLFAENREVFELAGVKVMVSNPSCICICQDKAFFVDFCADHNFCVPKTYTPNEIKSGIPFPVFIKPRLGKGGRMTSRIETEKELLALLERTQDVVVQECIEASEYTVDYFADFSCRSVSAVVRERVSIFGGESFVSKTVKQPEILKQVVRLSVSLGLVGHNTIQCFLRDQEVLFIEVNPRFGGGASLGFRAGAPTPRFLVRLLEGREVQGQLGEFIDDLYMLRYTKDIFVRGDNLA